MKQQSAYRPAKPRVRPLSKAALRRREAAKLADAQIFFDWAEI